MFRQLGVWLLAFGVTVMWVWPVPGWSKGSREVGSKLTRTLGLENEGAFFANLERHLNSWEFPDPGEWTKLLRRYHRSRAKYRNFLLRALRGQDRDRQKNALTLIGLLRLPEFRDLSTTLAQRETGDQTIQEGVAFYLHRIGQEPAKNFERLVARVPALIEKPNDDVVIFWLGFVDTPEPARSLLRKLREKSDGAVSELVEEALEWLSRRCPEDVTPPACKKDPWL